MNVPHEIFLHRFATPLGPLEIELGPLGLRRIDFGDASACADARLAEGFASAGREAGWEDHLREIRCRIQGDPPSGRLPVDTAFHEALGGGADSFRARTWALIEAIPHGEVASYGELARRLGRPAASRAVARACASNPLLIVVPCHRVIRSDGSPGGYRGGPDRKAELLRSELARPR